jgi:hypothetical protein
VLFFSDEATFCLLGSSSFLHIDHLSPLKMTDACCTFHLPSCACGSIRDAPFVCGGQVPSLVKIERIRREWHSCGASFGFRGSAIVRVKYANSGMSGIRASRRA